MKPPRPKLTPHQRLALLKEVLDSNKPVSEVCREYGISRTIFYRLKKRYLKSEEKDREKALGDLPSTPHHFRNLIPKEIEERILRLVSENPAYSTHKIALILKDVRGLPMISNKGVQNVFRRNNLSTYNQRLEYSKLTEAVWKPRWRVSAIPGIPMAIWRMLYAPFATIPKLGWLFTRGQLLLLAVFVSIFYFYHLLASIITSPTGSPIGTFFASIALSFGFFFFIYSMKYYLSTILVLRFAQVGASLDSSKSKSSKIFGVFSKLGFNLPKANTLNPLLTNLEKVQLDAGNRPFVSIHVALYNEKKVVERLIKACTAQDWFFELKTGNLKQETKSKEANYELILADDSNDETTEIAKEVLASGLGYTIAREGMNDDLEIFRFDPPKGSLPTVKLVHRFSRAGFKGAALQKALENTDTRSEYICVLDADFVPYPDTIEQFVKTFQVLNADSSQQTADSQAVSGQQSAVSNIAAVQGYQWHVLNKSQNWVTRGVRTEYAGSYVIERSGEEIYQGLKQIAGSVYMIRADILRKFGWGTSITEDFELTLRLYEAGYKVAFSPYIQAPAEAVSTIKRLIRQRMRWAEGASFNIKRMFKRMLVSPNLTGMEKLEFLYLTPYYLQAAFFVGGTFSWFFAEAILGSRLPFWTAALGWSLVFTNLLALPLMNIIGMFLEESEERDYVGILSFIALSYIVVPFQAYAAIKGFLEPAEGPWFRTPKTGLVTDTFGRSKFNKFFGNIFGGRSDSMPGDARFRGGAVGSLAFASAFNPLQGRNFGIRPRHIRHIGNLALGVIIGLTLVMSLFAPMIPTTQPVQAQGPGKLATVQDAMKGQTKQATIEPKEITTPQAVTFPTDTGENLEMIFHQEPRVRLKLGHKEIEITTLEIEGIGKANPKKSFIIGKNEVRYEEIVPDVDLVYKLSPKGYEEEFIIKRKVAISAVAQRVVLKDIKAVGVSGVYGFYDQDGYKISEFSDPFMYEQGNRGERTRKLKFELEKEMVGYSLIKRLEPEATRWLADAGRVYPVVLDPSVIISGGIATGDVDFGGQQQKLVQVSSAYYAFHNDGGSIDYQKCTDMVNRCDQDLDWGGNVTMNDGADTDNEGPDVFVDGTTLWVAWFDNTNTTGDDINFQSIDTANSDTQGTSVCSSADMGTVGTGGVVNISKGATSGDFVIAYDDDPDVLEVDGVDINCSATETFTDITTGSGITAADLPSIMADGDEVHFVWQEAGSLGIRHNYYDTTDATNAWGTEVAVDAGNLATSFGFTKASDGDFYVHATDGTTATDLYRCATPCTAAGRSWASVGAPFSSETNLTWATITYATTENDLVVSAIMDTVERAYFRTTDETTISYGCGTATDCDYGITGDGLEHISSMKVVANLADAGIVLGETLGGDFEFATVPERSFFLLAALPFLPKILKRLKRKKW